MDSIKIIAPFDAHIHWRILETLMSYVAPYSILQFAGGLLMPNTGIPGTSSNIISKKEIDWYKKQVKEVTKDNKFFTLLTYFLSPSLNEEDLKYALTHLKDDKFGFAGVKYYPKGGTTNSDKGMNGFSEVAHVLEIMQKHQIPLLIHGEVPLDKNNNMIDDFYREEIFYEQEMEVLRHMFPELPLVMEHITTAEAVDFVLRHKNIRATITPQHLLFDRRALFNGVTSTEKSFFYDSSKNGMNPVNMCRPILKKEKYVEALRNALKKQHEEGLSLFGLGTDSAPHTKEKKYCECGACGVFSAPIALELYAMAFEEIGILEHLPKFASEIMPNFYGIKSKLPAREMFLIRRDQTVRENYNDIVTPFYGQTIPWTLV